MKKLTMIMALATMFGFTACDSQTGGNTTSATTDAEQNSSNPNNNSSIVNAPTNDTTGASATEKTQTRVGNSQTRGEKNSSGSRTTQNEILKDSL